MTDLIIINADIVTMDPLSPRVSALAVDNGVITAMGESGSILGLKQRRTHVLDLKGKTVCPGFIDVHLHFRAMAESFVDIDLSPNAGIRSISDIQHKIHQETKRCPQGKWIRGVGYNEIYLDEHRHPNHRDLDKVSPDHPVKLTHRSGYAHVLNRKGLENVGINRFTPDPDGGIIERDLETGEPNGILYGMGGYLNQKIPELDEEDLRQGAKLANQKLISFGITSFQDASHRNTKKRFKWFERLKKEEILIPRIGVISGREWFKQRLEEVHSLFPEDVLEKGQIALSGVKIIIDETTGKLYPDQKELNKIVLSIHKAGQQAVIHAVDETAVSAAITAIENALTVYPKSGHRHRIEHCSICPPNLCKKIASLNIMVVTHPAFIYYNGDRYLETVKKEQLEFLYPISFLLKSGVWVAAASDSPIIKADPLAGIYGAVTRMTETGKRVPGGHGISPHEALGMYTGLAARADFEERWKGAISVGKYGDFVVLSDNPLTVETERIKDIEVEMTIIGGNIVWRKT